MRARMGILGAPSPRLVGAVGDSDELPEPKEIAMRKAVLPISLTTVLLIIIILLLVF